MTDSRPLFDGRIRYGGDYNPEQWHPDVWTDDVRLMQKANINLVTVGVFSWAWLEPREGQYDFGWIRYVLDLLADAGIGVDLATPTASPPPWLSMRYPDVLPTDERGARYNPGSRQHLCVCSPSYLRAAAHLVERLAAELGDHPALEMWHIHNEYACHVPYCYCDRHAQAFRTWLHTKYHNIEALNEAWGTAFWSQRYSEFAEVMTPRLTPTMINPCQALDYHEFTSDAFLGEMEMERRLLSQARPDLPVTTNFMGFFKPLDYFTWAERLDVVSTDSYPEPDRADTALTSAKHYDLVRSLNKSAPWMVMEQSSSRVNWRDHNEAKAPGEMRALSFQALARGADGVLFFQWRASRQGAEKFHSAMVAHSGEASPVWAEVVQLGQELATLGELAGSKVEPDVGLVYSWPNWWALEGPGMPANDLSLADQVSWLYDPLYRHGLTVDFCQPGEDLSRYRAIVVPSLYLVSEPDAANLVAFVEAGGTAIISFWSGIVDRGDRVYLGPYGGPLRSLVGCDVVEVAPLAPGAEVAVEWADGTRTAATFWTDIAAEGEGEVVARLASGPWAGRPVVVRTQRGAGQCFYVGARLDGAGITKLYSSVPELSERPDAFSGQVEHLRRVGSDATYDIVINHAAEDRSVAVRSGGVELLTAQVVSDHLVLAPQGVAVVRRGKA